MGTTRELTEENKIALSDTEINGQLLLKRDPVASL